MIIDDIIGFLSPRAGFKRIQYRRALNVAKEAKRKFEGATKGRRTEGWKTYSTSANAENGPALSILRDRSRDLVRNNPYAARGIQVIASNVIGKGIIPAIKTNNQTNESLQNTWKAWGESTACDYDGKNDFYGLQRLIMRAVSESGECFLRLRRTTSDILPAQLQLLESDFLPVYGTYSDVAKGNAVIQGVEFDSNGKRVAYHFYQDHPGNASQLSNLRSSFYQTVRIPAEEILHIYRQDRPGQIRGIPWLAPTMLRLRDFDEFEDAQLVRQKIAACFSVFIHDLEGQSDLDETEEEELGSKVQPGIIEMLPPGKDVKFANPPGVENYNEYTSVLLHSIAVGLGISYEALTGNLREVNFSSARMGWLEFQRNIDAWRSHIVSPQLNKPVFDWFLEGCLLVGLNTNNASAVWTAPRREMIDPTKEVPAKIKSVRAGFETLSDIISQNGKHPLDHLNEIKEDNNIIDSLELKLDSDPRNVTLTGILQDEKVEE